MGKERVDTEEFARIQKLIGEATAEQLRYIDCFTGERIALFMPVGGACFLALSPRHSHPSYMFILPFDDRTFMHIDGRVVPTVPGSVFVLSPGVDHHELPAETPPRYLAVMVAPTLFHQEAAQYPARPLAPAGEWFVPGRELLPLLRTFMIEADNSAPGRSAVIGALEIQICHSLLRSLGTVETGHDRVSSRMEIDRVVEFLHGNLDRKITVEEMARAAHMSHSHFCRVFRCETGQSPAEYLKRIRLERAKKLLGAGDLSMTDIALSCGFTSSAYLSACFAAAFHSSPSAYRDGLHGTITKKKGMNPKA